jgi:hypothetical protein
MAREPEGKSPHEMKERGHGAEVQPGPSAPAEALLPTEHLVFCQINIEMPSAAHVNHRFLPAGLLRAFNKLMYKQITKDVCVCMSHSVMAATHI